MRISDWSSDVCSSDLDRRKADDDHAGEDPHRPAEQGQLVEAHARRAGLEHAADDLDGAGDGGNLYEDDAEQPPVAGKSVGEGRSVSVSVDIGGGRIGEKQENRVYEA